MIFCKECKFWYNKSEGFGDCRIKPPVVVSAVVDRFGDSRGVFPITHSSTWCGEGRINDCPNPERK